MRGPPQAVWYADCGGTNFDQQIYWTAVSPHFGPGCSPLHAWHVLVGWRGHSVAAVEVSRRLTDAFLAGTAGAPRHAMAVPHTLQAAIATGVRKSPTMRITSACFVAGQQAWAHVLSLSSLPDRTVLPSLMTSTISHGVKLTLTVPRQVYPMNALIQVTLQLQNVSGRAIRLGVGNDSWCGERAPWAQVVKSNGSAVYPLAMPDAAGPSCAGMYSSHQVPGPPLAPGRRISRRFLVILRADRIRGIVKLFTSRGLLPVRTPSIHLRLVPGLSPHMAWTRSPAMQVDVRPGGSNWEGPLRYVFAWSCGKARTGFLQEGLDVWTVARGPRFRPGCVRPQQWDLVAGWLDHPVATIDYIRPSHRLDSTRLRW